MNEHDWLSSSDPHAMLGFCRARMEADRQCGTKTIRFSERKLRLFACAIARLCHEHGDKDSIMHLVEAVEKTADDPSLMFTVEEEEDRYWVKDEPQEAARCAAMTHADQIPMSLRAAILRDVVGNPFRSIIGKTCYRCAGLGGHILIEGKIGPFASPANAMSETNYKDSNDDYWRQRTPTHWQQCPNCHGVGHFSFEWITSKVVAFSENIYQKRDFDAMPVLADMLEENGCDNQDVLYHCRQTWKENYQHVRGCWVLDLLTGRK